MKRKKAAQRGSAKAKPYSSLSDSEQALAFGVFVDSNEDLDLTYVELKRRFPRKYTKKALVAMREDLDWESYAGEVRNRLMRSEVNNAVSRRKAQLAQLRESREIVFDSIKGNPDQEVAAAAPRSLGEAVDALAKIIELEDRLAGRDGSSTDSSRDTVRGLFAFAVERMREERKR